MEKDSTSWKNLTHNFPFVLIHSILIPKHAEHVDEVKKHKPATSMEAPVSI